MDNFHAQGRMVGRGVTRRTGTVGGLAMGRSTTTLDAGCVPTGRLKSMSGPAS